MPLCALFLQCSASAPAVHCIRSCSAVHPPLQCTAGKELCVCSLSFACIHLFSFDICLIKVPVFLPF